LAQIEFTCPRCFCTVSVAVALKFCPRCGLADAAELAADTAPMDVAAAGRTYRVEDRLAIGSVCNLYRCRFRKASREIEGIFKIARDARANELVANEAQALSVLHESEGTGKFKPFLPELEHSFALESSGSAEPRRANVLRMHPEIRSPDELYTLAEVRQVYQRGLDARDVAWIWRRLLSVLGYVHSVGLVHGAVLPMHVLIEPREHKLVLIDWCCANHPRAAARPVSVMGGFGDWYKRDGAARGAPTASVDLAFGARSMVHLAGGDPLDLKFPDSVEAGIQRHLARCVDGAKDAWKLLDDFDKLIEALWGPRQFRELKMPPRVPR
jgi:hypothetical protein